MRSERVALVFVHALTVLAALAPPVPAFAQAAESVPDATELRQRIERAQEVLEESQTYLTAGQAAWSAFVCAHLAVNRGDSEYERLVQFGYAQGERFVEGVRDGKVRREDLLKLPMVISFDILVSPISTTDFILGRMYQASKDVLGQLEYDATVEGAQKSAYAFEFAHRNCGVIGSDR